MAAARELVIPDEPAAWAALGFACGDDGRFALGRVGVLLGGELQLRVEGLGSERPDGLPVVACDAAAPLPVSTHPNGATAIDHVVVLTGDRDRTTAALAAAGGDVRRRGEPPELPARMAFVRFGELIVEVAEAGGPARFCGLTVRVPDVDALGIGTPRPAVQRGRRIVAVPRSAGLSVALAFITPP
jgi:hypothetical protein